MAGRKEIRSKIASIKNTQKITRAMEMVAVSKMRRAQERMHAARPYAAALERMIGNLLEANPEYRHPFTIPHPERGRIAILVIGTDRGLCGGLNSNLFRIVLQHARAWETEGRTLSFGVVGRKASSFFSSVGAKIGSQVTEIGDKPQPEVLRGIVHGMIKDFLGSEVDEVWLAYNRFVTTLTQKPVVERLLPIMSNREGTETDAGTHGTARLPWDYIYEPDPQSMLDALLLRSIETKVYHGLVENLAAEQAARMIAMQNASENAGQLIKELQLVYNKARQAAITQEIAEIVAGASAV